MLRLCSICIFEDNFIKHCCRKRFLKMIKIAILNEEIIRKIEPYFSLSLAHFWCPNFKQIHDSNGSSSGLKEIVM